MLENSRAKLEKKHLDMICANNLKVDGAGFGTDTNVVTLIRKHSEQELPLQSKEMVSRCHSGCDCGCPEVKMLGRQPTKRKWHTIFCLVSLLGVFLLSGCAGQGMPAAPCAAEDMAMMLTGTGQVRDYHNGQSAKEQWNEIRQQRKKDNAQKQLGK